MLSRRSLVLHLVAGMGLVSGGCSDHEKREIPSRRLDAGAFRASATFPDDFDRIGVVHAWHEPTDDHGQVRVPDLERKLIAAGSAVVVLEVYTGSASEVLVGELPELSISPDDSAMYARLVESLRVMKQRYGGKPLDLISVGHGAAACWPVLALHPDLISSLVAIAVPGVKNLDFATGQRVPVLALHAEGDHHVMETHAFVHRTLTFGREPHEMIEYDRVRSQFWDESSTEWDATTADDAFDRAARWARQSVGYTVR